MSYVLAVSWRVANLHYMASFTRETPIAAYVGGRVCLWA